MEFGRLAESLDRRHALIGDEEERRSSGCSAGEADMRLGGDDNLWDEFCSLLCRHRPPGFRRRASPCSVAGLGISGIVGLGAWRLGFRENDTKCCLSLASERTKRRGQ
jgi:hypothetical protein